MSRITCRVRVPRLNQRTSAVEDTSNKANIVAVVPAGYQFEATLATTNKLGDWYKDGNGYYYWGGGLTVDAPAAPESGADLPAAPPAGDFWFNALHIAGIWTQYGERGEGATALVLDSGINLNVLPVASALAGPVYDFAAGTITTTDDSPAAHGTHCAALIAARATARYIGAAPAARLYAGKVSVAGALDAATLNIALREFLKSDYAIDVISISQELYNPNDELYQLIKEHTARGRIIIASMGNDRQGKNSAFKRYPGYFDECIGVGSCTNEGQLSGFSMSPAKTTLFCYGENISSYQTSEIPGPLTGTSQAAAIVAGVVCLIVSYLKRNGFVYNSTAIRNLLTRYGSGLTGHPEYRLIQPALIFKKLSTFSHHDQNNLQACIDADNGSSM